MLDDADSYHGSGNAGDELRTLGVVKKNELLTSAAASHCGRFILGRSSLRSAAADIRY